MKEDDQQNEPHEITLKELRVAQRSMKNEKSPKYAGLPAEIFKLGGVVKEWMLRLFNSFWRAEA